MSLRGTRSATAAAGFRHRELFATRPGAARSRARSPRRSSADLGDRSSRVVPASPRRGPTSAFRCTSPQIEREVGGTASRRRRAGASTWRQPALHDSHRDADRTARSTSSARSRAPAGCRPAQADACACLLSGGIDSPVAALPDDAPRLFRCCSCIFTAIRSSRAPRRKKSARSRPLLTTLPAPVAADAGALRRAAAARCSWRCAPELRVVIYRRLMMRIAERLARRWRARALVTGEVIGQVASQTLENHDDHRRRDDAGSVEAAGGNGQGRNHRRRPAASAPFRFRSFPIRIAASCSRRAIRLPSAARSRSTGRAALPSPKWSTRRCRRHGGDFDFRRSRHIGGRQASPT